QRNGEGPYAQQDSDPSLPLIPLAWTSSPVVLERMLQIEIPSIRPGPGWSATAGLVTAGRLGFEARRPSRRSRKRWAHACRHTSRSTLTLHKVPEGDRSIPEYAGDKRPS